MTDLLKLFALIAGECDLDTKSSTENVAPQESSDDGMISSHYAII